LADRVIFSEIIFVGANANGCGFYFTRFFSGRYAYNPMHLGSWDDSVQEFGPVFVFNVIRLPES
jgi:hypothetical protein